MCKPEEEMRKGNGILEDKIDRVLSKLFKFHINLCQAQEKWNNYKLVVFA